MGLPCMNCGKDTPQSKAKLFAECMVCEDCFIVAERIYKQGQLELKYLLTTLKELIRLSIVQHKLSFPPPPEKKDGQVPERKAIDAIVEMMKQCPTHQPTSTKRPSRESMKPSALPAGGTPSSSSTSEADSKSETRSTETPATEPSDNA